MVTRLCTHLDGARRTETLLKIQVFWKVTSCRRVNNIKTLNLQQRRFENLKPRTQPLLNNLEKVASRTQKYTGTPIMQR